MAFLSLLLVFTLRRLGCFPAILQHLHASIEADPTNSKSNTHASLLKHPLLIQATFVSQYLQRKRNGAKLNPHLTVPGQMSMAGSRRPKKSIIDLDALSSMSSMSRGPAHEVTEQKFEDAVGEWEIGELDGEDPSVQVAWSFVLWTVYCRLFAWLLINHTCPFPSPPPLSPLLTPA